MSLKHSQKCYIAAKETIKNRIGIIKESYKKKNGRTAASLGALKTAAISVGYGVYALLPEKLLVYSAFNDVNEISHSRDFDHTDSC